MIILDKALERLAGEGKAVRIGLVGAGYMGRGIAAQTAPIPGIEVVAISNRTLAKAALLCEEVGAGPARRVETQDELEEAVARGIPAVTEAPELLCGAESVDVVIEATGSVEFGARVALDAIAHGKHVVLVNAELDSAVGPILKVKADQAGVVLTNTGGDEPGVTMDLLRYVRTIGLQPVLAGNIKSFLDRYRNPDTQRAFAASVGQSPQRVAGYADGTKLAMESTIVANATGFHVSRRGMNGFECVHVKDVLRYFGPDELLGGGLVDYVLGAEPGSGVFVVGHSDLPLTMLYHAHFKMGEGPLYVFYAPWHLPHAEAALTAARAALFDDATVTPLGPPCCDVVTIAKRALQKGEVLDGVGGFTCYGMIENTRVSRVERLLPMGLSEGCELLVDVGIDQALSYDDVLIPAGRLADDLRREQDLLFVDAA